MSQRTLWFSIILVILTGIYLLSTYNKSDIRETSKVIRKKTDRDTRKTKSIYISPKAKSIEINSMKKKLKKKLNKIKIDNKYQIKLFYADWCPHCVEFKPIWFSLKKKYNNIDFIEVDCTNANPDLDYVNGFPTIALFNLDKHIENYENERTLNGFENYIKNLI